MAQATTEKKETKTNSGGSSSSPKQEQTRPARGGGSNRTFQQNRRPPYRRQFRPRRKVCLFCANREKIIDWKEIESLRRIVDDSGRIHPRRKTGTCAKHQRQLAIAIKRARHLALLPFTNEHIRLMSKS